jgi:antitoxin component of RelBE/YafQ-DinJ toxin-antitoxin module
VLVLRATKNSKKEYYMVSVNMDKNLQERAEIFFSEFGLDLGTAMNMLVAQSLKQGKNPFVSEYKNNYLAEVHENEERLSDEEYKADLLKALERRFGANISEISELTLEELEDIYDAKSGDEAYEEYVKDGKLSYPIEDLFKKYGVI